MGIRVHKFLGYGFPDVAVNDPRVNWGSPLVRHEYDGDSDWDSVDDGLDGLSGEAYWRYLERQPSAGKSRRFSLDYLMLAREPGLRTGTLRDAVVPSPAELPGVIALRPLSLKDWARSDDPIDYVGETHLRKPSQEPRVDVLPTGIFPFNGLYMDSRTGERLPHESIWFVRLMKADGIDAASLDEAARAHTPFESAEEASRCIVPLVPEEVADICAFTRLTAEPDGWKSMVPMLLTWWA